VTSAKRIAAGSKERLTLGRLDIARDWGAASEYVDAMWRMLQCDEPSDFVIATGQTHTLETFVTEAFTQLGLDWEAHVDQSTEFFRPTDLLVSRACPEKAEQVLGWKAKSTMPDVITCMLNAI